MVVFCRGGSPPSSSAMSSDADVESGALPASSLDDSSVLDTSLELRPLPLPPVLLPLELLLLRSNEQTLLIINLHLRVPCNLDESMSSSRLTPTSFPNLSRTIISTTRSLHRSDLVIQLEIMAVGADDADDDDSASLPSLHPPLPDADADGRL